MTQGVAFAYIAGTYTIPLNLWILIVFQMYASGMNASLTQESLSNTQQISISRSTIVRIYSEIRTTVAEHYMAY
jgi:ABC-type lipoprotein release transport system permease subunit